jgi:hypothetical protein
LSFFLYSCGFGNYSGNPTYGIDNYFFGPYTPEDFQNILQGITGQTAVIEKELKDYSYTINGADYAFFDTTEYKKMANEWLEHRSNLSYIYENGRISTDLTCSCHAKISRINHECSIQTVTWFMALGLSINLSRQLGTELFKFHYTPIYALGRYLLDSFYLTLKAGYNLFTIDEELPEEVNLQGGLFYGIGGGMDFGQFQVELLYSINNGARKMVVPPETFSLNYKYSKISLSVGYKL